MKQNGVPTGGVGVVLAGGGSGQRLGASVPKAFVRLAGRELFRYSLDAFHALPEVEWVVFVVPAEMADGLYARLARRYQKLCAVVKGGRRRQDSVSAGVRALPPCSIVLIHDAARPLVSWALVRRVIAGVRRWGACVPAVPVTDTVKRVESGRVVATLDRTALVEVQTPQGFRRELCEEMYRRQETATDDAFLAERCGYRVGVVRGDENNVKITLPRDLLIARALLRAHNRQTEGT